MFGLSRWELIAGVCLGAFVYVAIFTILRRTNF
jgi:hypothetical protein